MNGYPPGTRVVELATGELGVIEKGGTERTRLVLFDNGTRGYYPVGGLDKSDAPIATPEITEAVSASETPEDDAPLLPDPPDGIDNIPAEVTPPAASRKRMGRRWTRDAIIQALHQWAETHGGPPDAKEWEKGGDHPSYATVRNHFGTWANALAAAGYPTPTRGPKPRAAAPADLARVDAPTPGSQGVDPGAHAEPQPPRAPNGSPIARWLESITAEELRAEVERIEQELVALGKQLAVVEHVLQLKEAA